MSIRTPLAAAALFALALPASADASGSLLVKASFPAATAAVPGGGLEYGELRTGRIWKVDAKGRRGSRPLATVKVESNGLAGLLGLAVDGKGRTFAAFTSSAKRLVVEQVAPGRPRLVYDAGRAAQEANGGRLAFRADGKL